jgi:hypothetical protein
VRGHIGSFADQVYPIYGLSVFGNAYGLAAAHDQALACAEAICRVQGPLGQWWWHYNASNGAVFEQYPVYTVHQDAMAPMALFAIAESRGVDFTGPIYRGLEWITGKNELTCDLRHASQAIIWRSVYHGTKLRTSAAKALRYAGLRSPEEPTDDLNVRFEDRPYHFGWVLYAFAGR